MGDIITQRPQHAAAALRIIMAASDAELAVAVTLLNIAPRSSAKLADLFEGQNNETKKWATINAVAATHLTPELLALFERVMRVYRAAQKERTPFAHWTYAYTHEREDLLILIDPKKELRTQADLATIHLRWLGENYEPASSEDRAKMVEAREASMNAVVASALSYDLAELERIISRLSHVRACFELLIRLTNWVGARTARDLLLDSLERVLQDLE
jgi:hypothetical protein